MIDHLAYAVPDLETAIRDVSRALGVTPSPGGQHLGHGTRNYLLSLGNGSYLEIIGPDADQLEPNGPRPLGVDQITSPRLTAWAVTAPGIENRVALARAAGYDPGPASSMSRTQPDGTVLGWKLTPFPTGHIPFLVPFLIDWGDTPHPSTTAAQGARLLDFRIETPDPDACNRALEALDLEIRAQGGEASALIANLAGPTGQMTLR